MFQREKYIELLKNYHKVEELATMTDMELLSEYNHVSWDANTLSTYGLYVGKQLMPAFNDVCNVLKYQGFTTSAGRVYHQEKPINKTWLNKYRHDLFLTVVVYENLYFLTSPLRS